MSTHLTTLLFALTALAPQDGGVPRPAASARTASSALSSGDIVELSLVCPPGTSVEHFRLDLTPWEAEAPVGSPAGLVRWLRGPVSLEELAPVDRWSATAGRRIEVEIDLFAERTRVLHAERLHPEERSLVWREVRAHSGRTVLAEWRPDGGIKTSETVGGDIVRREHEVRGAAFFPLALVEQVRNGARLDGVFQLLQPLASTLEALEVRVEEPRAGVRELTLRRAGGLFAGRYRFHGQRLVAFQWAEGGPVGRPLEADAYETWRVGRGAARPPSSTDQPENVTSR